MGSEAMGTCESECEEHEPLYLYKSEDGSFVITRADFETLTSGERSFDILCKDSEEGILPFLVAESDTYDEDIYDLDSPGAKGIVHVCAGLPVPRHFGLEDDDSLMVLYAGGGNSSIILRKFHWCIFTPVEDDPLGDTYELRFVTKGRDDAEFVKEAFGCCDPVVVPIADPSFDIV